MAQEPPEFSGSNTNWTLASWAGFHSPSMLAMLNTGEAAHAVPKLLSSAATVVSFVLPDESLKRTRRLSTPQLPLVRRAKKRTVGRLMSMHTAGETAVPVASMASDFESP